MRMLVFAKRNFKEILRDFLNLVFLVLLPLMLLIIFQQFKIPSEVYSIKNFTPSVSVFSFGFISLFAALLIAKDRTSSLLTRLYASPLTSLDFIMGYSLAVLPIAIIQSIIFYICAILLGLEITINILISILVLIPISLLFIALRNFIRKYF